MKYAITEEDKSLILQPSLQYKYRLLVVDDEYILDEIQGISAIGSYSIDSESDIRRTTSFTLMLDNCYRTIMSVEKKLLTWIGYDFQMQIGIYSLRKNDFVWFDCGYYLITEGNTSYNSTDNSLNLNLCDWYSKLNGTRNGQVGGRINVEYKNVDDNGDKITIKDTTEIILKTETMFNSYIVEDIGEPNGMKQSNSNYLEYRDKCPLWNQLPYDLKYEAGCTVGDIFDEIKNIYPNCEMCFDIYGNFCFNMIPSFEHDSVVLDDSYLQKILLAQNTESVTYDVESIKNVTEVFGNTYQPDRFSTNVTTNGNIYTALLDSYEGYSNNHMIAFTPNSSNISEMKISINSLDALPIFYEYTDTYIEEGLLVANKTYVLQIRLSGSDYVAYYLGQFQPHALCVLTDNENDPKYTKKYFAEKYNCNERNITFRVEPESPFTIQKLGEILDVKTGEKFDNILSDSVAIQNAICYNLQSSSVYDTVQIYTKMIPFLDVNEKVEYRKQQETESKQYIVKLINNDMESMTSQITMYRFYPLII